MTNEEKERALLDLLGEAEILLLTAPGTFTAHNAWREWQDKKTAWLNKLSKTLIVDMNKEKAE